MRLLLPAALALSLLALAAPAQGVPRCSLAATPGEVQAGDRMVFLVDCEDLDSRLSFLRVLVDGAPLVDVPAGDRSGWRFEVVSTAPYEGWVVYEAAAFDTDGVPSNLLQWEVSVLPASGGFAGGGAELASAVGGLTAVGGGIYGVRRYRKAQRAKADAAGSNQAGVNTGTMASSGSGAAAGSNSGTLVSNNSGTVAPGNSGTMVSGNSGPVANGTSGPVAQGNSGPTIQGNSGTIILQSSAPTGPTAPAGVPSRCQDLYLVLDEAHDLLDDPSAGAHVIVARDMVEEMLSDLRAGKTPKSSSRLYTASAIEQAITAAQSTRVQGGIPALQLAVAKLRK